MLRSVSAGAGRLIHALAAAPSAPVASGQTIRVRRVGCLLDDALLLEDRLGASVVDGFRRQQAEGVMAMPRVIPGEEALAERPGPAWPESRLIMDTARVQ
jgi:hypothetical protein